jgi:hydroxymethylpyrimidine pyrophosphatase-like HAD family hydrolase
MSAVLAIDLDQTLIYSHRSAGPVDDPVWVEDYQDAPLSLMTRRAHELLTDLQQRHHVVPVTTRTPEQYQGVRLPLAPPSAVTCTGGIRRRAGRRDADWDAHVAADLATVAPAKEAASHFGDFAWVSSWRQVEDLFVYTVAHSRDDIPAEWVSAVAAWCAEHGWTLSVQGRKAYAVPHVLSKGAAALRVAERLGGPLLAAGDSLLDRDLLEAAVFAVRPAHGELQLLGYDGAQVTARSGAHAAEDLLLALGAYADGQVD